MDHLAINFMSSLGRISGYEIPATPPVTSHITFWRLSPPPPPFPLIPKRLPISHFPGSFSFLFSPVSPALVHFPNFLRDFFPLFGRWVLWPKVLFWCVLFFFPRAKGDGENKEELSLAVWPGKRNNRRHEGKRDFLTDIFYCCDDEFSIRIWCQYSSVFPIVVNFNIMGGACEF